MSLETDRIEADLDQSRHRLNDTLQALGSKLSPGQMVDEVMGLAQGQAGKLVSNLGRQVRDNPLPVLLVAAGIGLFFLNNRHSHGDGHMSAEDWETQRTYHSLEEARWNTPRQAGETDDAYEERVHHAYAEKLNLKQKADEAAHEFKERVSQTVAGIRRRATGLGARVSRMASGAGARASQIASTASSFAQSQAHRLGDTASNVRHRAEDFYQDTPLAAGGIAFAVGALIGGATPLSDRERESLRPLADRAVRTGAEIAERGARMADRAGANNGGDGAVH